VERVIELDEALVNEAIRGNRTKEDSKQYDRKTLAQVLGNFPHDISMWYAALNDSGVEGPYVLPDPQYFIAALKKIISSYNEIETFHYLLLRILRKPLRDSYITSSWKQVPSSERARNLCRERLSEKYLAPWNILAIKTLTSPSSLQDTNVIFETAKEAIMNHTKTSTDLKSEAKDRIMDRLLVLRGNIPVSKDHGGYISYRYNNVPDMSAQDMYANEWKLQRHDVACHQSHRLLCEPLQDQQKVGVSLDVLTVTAALLQTPLIYAGSERFLNTATMAYVILLKMLEDLLSPLDDVFTPTSRKHCLQLQMNQTGASDLMPFTAMYALSMALRIAYDLEEPSARTVDDVPDDVTEDQLFFLRACLLFCDANNSSLARAKCNGAVQNMPEFYRAFWCPATQKMPQVGVCQLR
ncbi:unnamed protein product, partial [Ixodes persulcatus]